MPISPDPDKTLRLAVAADVLAGVRRAGVTLALDRTGGHRSYDLRVVSPHSIPRAALSMIAEYRAELIELLEGLYPPA